LKNRLTIDSAGGDHEPHFKHGEKMKVEKPCRNEKVCVGGRLLLKVS